MPTILGYEVQTLATYNTPYYFAVGAKCLGSVNHFDSIRKLTNYMNRMVKAGKLTPKAV